MLNDRVQAKLKRLYGEKQPQSLVKLVKNADDKFRNLSGGQGHLQAESIAVLCAVFEYPEQCAKEAKAKAKAEK